MSRWWKCDLQIATPAWDFKIPPEYNSDWSIQENMDAFAEAYCDKLLEKGIEVVALADHNTGAWIDTMVRAGEKKGVAVFPGCEITTGTGCDGVHLIVIGDRSKSSADFDRLLSGHLGFPSESDRFNMMGDQMVPASSKMTLIDILDVLPNGYVAYAPHALNDNGIASSKTVKGDLRWKALHHPRLAAIDVGEGSREGESFAAKFRRRALNDFPCVQYLPFVRSSDAYKFSDIGSAFSWIRMREPSIEGLRQAFLDYETRVLASDDPRLESFIERDPNNIRHGWIQSVSLSGDLANTDQELTLSFHPGLNVLIGGRGSGKSTVVAALRAIYAGTDGLPASVKQESQAFQTEVFGGATLSSTHFVSISQEKQAAEWKQSSGSETTAGTDKKRTSFKVHVFSQKELFERVRSNPDLPYSASQSFLAMVDSAIGMAERDDGPDTWAHHYRVAKDAWQQATRVLLQIRGEVAHLSQVEAEIQELAAQISAFDSEGGKEQRDSHDKAVASGDLIAATEASVTELIESLPISSADVAGLVEERHADAEKYAENDVDPDLLTVSQQTTQLAGLIAAVEERLREALSVASQEAVQGLAALRGGDAWKAWEAEQSKAAAEYETYLQSLESKGLSVDDYKAMVQNLSAKQDSATKLKEKEKDVEESKQSVDRAWSDVCEKVDSRRRKRDGLLAKVKAESGQLSFSVTKERDIDRWSSSIRELAGLRADAYVDDVPRLAKWIWHDQEVNSNRAETWRSGIVDGDLTSIAADAMRPQFRQRLESLDQTIRLRIAVEIPDDQVEIRFLREGGKAENPHDWQSIEKGSAGQKTAAMLGFILNHGTEPLILDQPEDDLDSEMVTHLVVEQLRRSRWKRQVIIVSHNANVPVNGDAEQVVVLENVGRTLRVRSCHLGDHCGPIEHRPVREDIQKIMEGGTEAFERRERRYRCFDEVEAGA